MTGEEKVRLEEILRERYYSFYRDPKNKGQGNNRLWFNYLKDIGIVLDGNLPNFPNNSSWFFSVYDNSDYVIVEQVGSGGRYCAIPRDFALKILVLGGIP